MNQLGTCYSINTLGLIHVSVRDKYYLNSINTCLFHMNLVTNSTHYSQIVKKYDLNELINKRYAML